MIDTKPIPHSGHNFHYTIISIFPSALGARRGSRVASPAGQLRKRQNGTRQLQGATQSGGRESESVGVGARGGRTEVWTGEEDEGCCREGRRRLLCGQSVLSSSGCESVTTTAV